ncbi:glycosyltransferase family protein [Mangrovibacterium lignilyticum]|uniref:hypothetical protein n=1 Tax=Mangrovibacterium lignilyticum TaxID=2668052 RepID=UPI0019681DE0|nr:hypothetical protein [Mangrovibacterium lignilyticum]
MKKVIAISSQGGHWIQLKRILPALEKERLILVSTFTCRPILPNNCFKYYSVQEASRWNKMRLIKQFWQVGKIVWKEKPNKVITTGAAVGIGAIIVGRLIGAKTVWIDSIANFEQLSLSGKIAKYFAHYHLTQWPHLEKGKTIYKGAVI